LNKPFPLQFKLKLYTRYSAIENTLWYRAKNRTIIPFFGEPIKVNTLWANRFHIPTYLIFPELFDIGSKLGHRFRYNPNDLNTSIPRPYTESEVRWAGIQNLRRRDGRCNIARPS